MSLLSSNGQLGTGAGHAAGGHCDGRGVGKVFEKAGPFKTQLSGYSVSISEAVLLSCKTTFGPFFKNEQRRS